MDELEKRAAMTRGWLSVLRAAPIEERKVARIMPEQNDGLGVSTVQSPASYSRREADISEWEYETAILDAEGAHPVERYHTLAEAEAGHLRWVEASKDLITVIRIGGMEGVVPDKEVHLKRVP